MSGSAKAPQIALEDLADIDTTLLMLRKPTDLKKVIDSVPKPVRAVPKYGLPLWYKLGLECKLPVPKMPAGKIIFARGKIGEDVRRVGLGTGATRRQTFDLTDPYCNNVSYEYVAMHDPHLAHHFAQKPARARMQRLGFCTEDGRAICSLKEFNQYRKFLYNQYMDRIHMEMDVLDERARDDLTLKRVDADVERRRRIFIKAEKTREHLEWIAREHAEGWVAKKRAAKAREQKIQERMVLLAEFNRKQREERAIRAAQAQNRIKQRVQAAAEIELRRKITMVRLWRANEKKRLERLKVEKEKKEKQKEDLANNRWYARVNAQNAKIQEEQLLLKLYSEDMAAAAARRAKKTAIAVYNTDLEQQQIRFANWRAAHSGADKMKRAISKMGAEFAKSKRGAKGMNTERARKMATDIMATVNSTKGDPLMTLGQARAIMDVVTTLPAAPINILEDALEFAITEFARRRVHQLLRNVEQLEYSRAATVFFRDFRPPPKKKGRGSKPSRWSIQLAADIAKQFPQARASGSIVFGPADEIPGVELEENIVFKSVKNRPPTPVPSLTKLAEVTFGDKIEDLPDPVTHGSYLPERRKLLDMVAVSGKLISKSVSVRVENGMNVETNKVTLPRFTKHAMEWGEAVEALASAVVNNRIQPDSADIRHTSEFLTHRILKSLLAEMKREKARLKQNMGSPTEKDEVKYSVRDFYEPEKEKEVELENVEESPKI